jgi:hypothetical protein
MAIDDERVRAGSVYGCPDCDIERPVAGALKLAVRIRRPRLVDPDEFGEIELEGAGLEACGALGVSGQWLGAREEESDGDE